MKVVKRISSHYPTLHVGPCVRSHSLGHQLIQARARLQLYPTQRALSPLLPQATDSSAVTFWNDIQRLGRLVLSASKPTSSSTEHLPLISHLSIINPKGASEASLEKCPRNRGSRVIFFPNFSRKGTPGKRARLSCSCPGFFLATRSLLFLVDALPYGPRRLNQSVKSITSQLVEPWQYF